MHGSTIKIGLTGGIGSGKTTVSNMFSEIGVPIIDADIIARKLLEPGTPASQKVLHALGSDIEDKNSGISRERLRQLIFSDTKAKEILESILHPLVHDEIQRQSAQLNTPYCIIVIPLLIEAGHQDLVDRILVINTTRKIQIARTQARDSTSDHQVKKIIDSQISSDQRIQLADDVITNNSGLEELKIKVLELDKKYRSL